MDISLILINGKIYTMDGNIFEAMAVSKDKIIKLGTNSIIKSMATSTTVKIDLKGKALFPGFNDSHLHLQMLGSEKNSVALGDCKSIKQLIEKGKKFMAQTNKKAGEWIFGGGFNQNNFASKEFPTKDDLDKISTENPIIFVRVCFHTCVMNSLALKMLGITKDTFINGGVFEKDSKGNLNGIAKENAFNFVQSKVPRATISQIKNDLSKAIKEALSFGVTSLQTSDLHNGIKFEEMYEAYMALKNEGKLKARINEQLFLPSKETLLSYFERDFKNYEGDDFFSLGPIKLFTDGSLGARTAALKEDYSDDPGNKGTLTYTQHELEELVNIVHQKGIQLTLHAIGDAALKSCLEAIEKAYILKPTYIRHRLNHCQIGNIELFEKMAKLGIVADIQPSFVSTDWSTVENRVGKERAKISYAWKTMIKTGVRLTAGTDAPVESINPMYGIYAAVTRKDLSANPPRGWLSEEKLSLYKALELYTKGSAYASYDENQKGTITEGKLADMVVLSEDPFEVSTDDIKNIEVLTTIVGGEIVFSKI